MAYSRQHSNEEKPNNQSEQNQPWSPFVEIMRRDIESQRNAAYMNLYSHYQHAMLASLQIQNPQQLHYYYAGSLYPLPLLPPTHVPSVFPTIQSTEPQHATPPSHLRRFSILCQAVEETIQQERNTANYRPEGNARK